MRCPHCQPENRGAPAFVRHAGSPSPQSAPHVAGNPCSEQPSAITVGFPTGTTTAAAPLPLAPRPGTSQAYTPMHLTEKILASCATPGEHTSRVRQCSPVSRLRRSCWPTEICERHGTQWSPSWVMRWKNYRSKRLASMACATSGRWPCDRPRPTPAVGRPYGYAQYRVGAPARQGPPMGAHRWEDAESDHWVALVNRSTREWGKHCQ